MGNKQIREAETKLYSESHTKNLLTDERRKLTTILNLLRTENQNSDRTIKQLKHFNSKREKAHKEMQEQGAKNEELIENLNRQILSLTWSKEKEKHKLSDKTHVNEQKIKTSQMSAECNAIEIDIKIAESRVQELKGKRDQVLKEIQDILAEKRVVEKECQELEHKIQGRG